MITHTIGNQEKISDLDHGHVGVPGDPEGEWEHRVLLVVVGLKLADHVEAVDTALDAPS